MFSCLTIVSQFCRVNAEIGSSLSILDPVEFISEYHITVTVETSGLKDQNTCFKLWKLQHRRLLLFK